MSLVVEVMPRRKLVPRMPGRGDLLIEVVGDRVLLRADQVEALAGIPPWSTGETLIDDEWEYIDGTPAYPLEAAVARCESAGTDDASTFLNWLNATLVDLLQDDALDMAQKVPSFVGSHSVAAAARHLSAEPGIRIGQTALFQHMHSIGWLDRADGDWVITHLARRSGWLTPRAVPRTWDRKRPPYPQVHVTPEGVEQLRLDLLTLNHDPPRRSEHPTLFD